MLIVNSSDNLSPAFHIDIANKLEHLVLDLKERVEHLEQVLSKLEKDVESLTLEQINLL